MNAQRVAVIGGGIIGCSIAWRLAQRGVAVTLIEKHEPGTKASWAAAGMLLPILQDDSPLRNHAAASFTEYPDFVNELRAATGIDAELNVEGAHSGSVDNRKLTAAVAQAARNAGADFLLEMAARNVECPQGTFQRVELADGSFVHADAVVIAAGAWSGEILGLPLRLPVVPVRGQMLAVEQAQPKIEHIIEAERCYLVPRGNRVLVGATVEHVGFDESTTDEAINELMMAARELAPQLADSRVIETWAGLRPGTPDDLPILGSDPHVEGVYYATGHFRNGILLAPLTARVISELIIDGTSSIDVTDFSVARFVISVADPHCDLCGAPMKEWN